MANKRKSQRLWRGLASLTASVTALAFVGTGMVNSFRTDIDKFLGTSSTRLVTDEEDEGEKYLYTSDYASTTELVQGIADLGERMQEEGTVLLKNENGALPLTEDEKSKVSLLGFSSYYPVQGGDMGSSLTPNSGTDADTVDFVGALDAKGFKINKDLKDLYAALLPNFQTEIDNWGNVSLVNSITAPMIGTPFTSKEPSQSMLSGENANWKDTLKSNNVLIVTIARAAGENRNYMPGEAGVDPAQKLNQTDPLGLSDDERDLLKAAAEAKKANGGKLIVLLNNASTLEVQEIEDNADVDSILEIGLPGGYGFYGVCDVLSGEVNPSGHLSDTYAVKNSLSPAAQNYGFYAWTNADDANYINSEQIEAEGIYKGYKYYETRYADTVLGQGNADSKKGSIKGAWNYDNEVTYPFGYGLSYTTFEQKLTSVNVDLTAKTVTATVEVKNTGEVAGKDAVQLYVSVPYTDYDKENHVEKAAIQLLDYSKTGVIEPGASETVTITADAQYMASWDSLADNAKGTKGTYILDAGDYYFTVGNGSHEAVNNVLAAAGQSTDGDAKNVQTWNLGALDNLTFAETKNGTKVENQLVDMDYNYWEEGTVTYLSRSDWDGTWPVTYENLTANDKMMEYLDNDIYEITSDNGELPTFGAQNGLTLADLKGVIDLTDERWSQLMDQITLEECLIRTGFGGTSTKAIDSISSPEAVQNDGPNGIYSYPLGQYANKDKESGDPCAIDEKDKNAGYMCGVMANETVIAATFNKELVHEYGVTMGNYSLWANLPIYWGASANIHRLPYNARNHEYYSEDPMLSAGMAAEFVSGGKEKGLIVAIKHFAFNDTEINRSGIATFMTEQAAREGELRCYQKSVEDVGTLGVMTSYNRVGVIADNAHTGLLTNILRGEWGFKGLMSEDFIMDPNYVHLKEAVVNGVTMSCNTGDNTMQAVSEKYPYWTVKNVEKDAVLTNALKQVMTYQAYALANSNAMDGYSSSTHLEKVNTWYDNLFMALKVIFALLTLLNLVMYVRATNKKEA
ncbi:MAG: glycoside hydrolase family 3 C-terminal domain-containing protein [Lachnospiraceae bacterium]|nr:glycoside hydrolase family 3 C-terminal domain-containing protein [Lachnospiraceae bacterium]